MDKEKEIKIVAPEGYEIDNENSTFECIKFKKKEEKSLKSAPPGTYFYVASLSNIMKTEYTKPLSLDDRENFNMVSHEKYAKSVLAYCRLSLLIEKDPRYGGPITDKEWISDNYKYIIDRYTSGIEINTYSNFYSLLAFHTEKQAQLFLTENEQLIKDYYCL